MRLSSRSRLAAKVASCAACPLILGGLGHARFAGYGEVVAPEIFQPLAKPLRGQAGAGKPGAHSDKDLIIDAFARGVDAFLGRLVTCAFCCAGGAHVVHLLRMKSLPERGQRVAARSGASSLSSSACASAGAGCSGLST
jgi:hypothetical protein